VTRLGGDSADSGMYSSHRKQSSGSTTSYVETDIDSVDDDRYQGELFKPRPAPRVIDPHRARAMFGEVHPKQLKAEEIPVYSSGDELETGSVSSVPSFRDLPTPAPRASMRKLKKHSLPDVLFERNGSGHASDSDDGLAERCKSLPRGILKSNSLSIELSDAESLAASSTGGQFRRTASGRKVRFTAVDKGRTLPRKTIDYQELDETEGKKRKGSGSADVWSHVKPQAIKPARNDPKRMSGGKGRSSRSSSADRKSR